MMDKMMILRGVAAALNVTTDSILSKRRDARISEARHAAMYLLYEMSGDSYPTIGEFLHRDHSTVIHGYNKVARRCAASPDYARCIDSVRTGLMASPSTIPGWGMCAPA